MGEENRDSIARIRVEGLRTLAEMTIELDGLVVLIGENSTGKSSIIEALELLRRSSSGDLAGQINQVHLGWPTLIRQGADQLRLGLDVKTEEGLLRYDLSLGLVGTAVSVVEETLRIADPDGDDTAETTHARPVIKRDLARATITAESGEPTEVDVHRGETVVSALGTARVPPTIKRLKAALASIDVHLPFDVGAGWGHQTLQRSSPVREAVQLDVAQRLERHGANLTNVWHTLQNDFGADHWQTTMDYVRLGLGADVETVVATARHGRAPGQMLVGVKYRSFDKAIPATALSDGTLSYLCFVALSRMTSGRTLLAFDEPENHLHPALLARVAGLLEATAEDHPVILATHSDRLLDALSDPGSSVVLCELDDKHATKLRRPDEAALSEWLGEYSGYGGLRAAGLEPVVTTRQVS